MKILITGASGLIGSALTHALHDRGDSVLAVTRRPHSPSDIVWDIDNAQLDLSSAGHIDAVVHLASENLAGHRWNEEQKERIFDSRAQGTRLLCETIAALPNPPSVLVSASGAHFYKINVPDTHTESSPPGSHFLAQVCQAWESATDPARDAGIRVVNLRLGMVLDSHGGALARMLPIFKRGFGGKLGSGKQRMCWIAIDDVIEIILTAIADDRFDGPFNAVAPETVTNTEFTRALAKAVHRPALTPAPAFALRAAFGEMADAVLLSDLAAEPARLRELDYRFRFPALETALAHLLEP